MAWRRGHPPGDCCRLRLQQVPLGLPGRGPGLLPRRHAHQGHLPAQLVAAVGGGHLDRRAHRGRGEPGCRGRVHVRAHDAGRPGDRRPGGAVHPQAARDCPPRRDRLGAPAGRLDPAWPHGRAVRRLPAPPRDSAVARADARSPRPRRHPWHGSGGPRRARGRPLAPRERERPPPCCHRPRPHRLGVVVAVARDGAQVCTHVYQRDGADGRASRLCLLVLVRPAVQVDEGLLPGGLRAHQGEGRGRSVCAGRGHVGRVRHQHARLRGHGTPVHRGQAVFPRGVWCRVRGGVAARLLRLLGGTAPDRLGGGGAMVPHPEDLVEPGQPDAPPHVLVGGHRRHARVHPLPAGGHLHLRPERDGGPPRRAQLLREGQGDGVADPVRLG